MKTRKLILLDFDSTVVLNESPFIGKEIPHAVEVVKKLQNSGHDFILHTMRVDNLLTEAEHWLSSRGIHVTYINCNPEYETGSRKCYADLILDDKCCGIPLIYNPEIHKKPFVNWIEVEKILVTRGFL